MFLNIFKSKRGDSTIYELLISIALLTFVIMFPIGVFSYMRTEININDVVNLSIQSIEKSGQLTPSVLMIINDNLEEKNLPTFQEGTVLMTNLEVTTNAPNMQVVTGQKATSIGINKNYGDFVKVIPDKSGATYLKKYRNAYITRTSWANGKTVFYDIKCNNTSCSQYGKIKYITNNMDYKCPSCGNISKLEVCNEANVVYISIAVPITEKVQFLNRVMKLISFRLGDSEIFTNSNNFINNNGEYYFIKTLYAPAEMYYYRGKGVIR